LSCETFLLIKFTKGILYRIVQIICTGYLIKQRCCCCHFKIRYYKFPSYAVLSNINVGIKLNWTLHLYPQKFLWCSEGQLAKVDFFCHRCEVIISNIVSFIFPFISCSSVILWKWHVWNVSQQRYLIHINCNKPITNGTPCLFHRFPIYALCKLSFWCSRNWIMLKYITV
jgi:hypothetical protein